MFWKKNGEKNEASQRGTAPPERAPAVPPSPAVPVTAAPVSPAAMPTSGAAAAAEAPEAPPAAHSPPPASSPSPAPTPSPATTPGVPLETGLLREQVIGQLRTVYDPEIPVNIYEMGLVYKIDVDAEGNVKVEMTLTSPACPSAAEIPLDVRRKVESIEGVKSVDVEIVWDPPWSMEFMSEAARVQLGFF